MFCCERSPELSAVRLIAVACTVDSRFSAVTTISSNSFLLSPAADEGGPAAAGSAIAGAYGSAAPSSTAGRNAKKVDGDKNAAARAAHDVFCIAEVLPEKPPV